MRKILCAITFCVCLSAPMFGQFTYGIRVSASPSVDPGTNPIIVNRSLSNEGLLNISHVKYAPQIGAMARLEQNHFWLMGELLYSSSTMQYSMNYLNESDISQSTAMVNEKRTYLDIPLSIGVSLGMVEVFSGFSMSCDLGYKSALEDVESYRTSIPSIHYGWHSGIGLNLGNVLLDVRYAQQFGNYGQGRYINDSEILLRNSPGHVVVSLGYRI